MRPWRGPAPGRPELPLPPGRMPLLRGGRPLKRWTWVGAFGPDVMLCAAVARIGPLATSWWAVWDGSGAARADGAARARRDALAGADPGRAVARRWATRPRSRWSRRTARSTRGRASAAAWPCAARRSAARSTRSGWSTSRPATTPATPRGGGRRASASPRRASRWRGTSSTGCTTASPSERTVWVGGEPHEVAPARVRRAARGRRPALHRRGHAVAAREPPDRLLGLRAAVRRVHRRAAGGGPAARGAGA